MKKILCCFFFILLIVNAQSQSHSERNKNIKKLVASYEQIQKNLYAPKHYRFEVIDPLAPGAHDLYKVKKINYSGSLLKKEVKECSEALIELQLAKKENGKNSLLFIAGFISAISTFGGIAASENSESVVVKISPFLLGGISITSFLMKRKPIRKRTIHVNNAIDNFNIWIAEQNHIQPN
jgi:hypothetical protein